MGKNQTFFYRHPLETSSNKLNKELESTHVKIQNNNKTNIIRGDFNYSLVNYEYNKFINNLLMPCTHIIFKHILLNLPGLFKGKKPPW